MNAPLSRRERYRGNKAIFNSGLVQQIDSPHRMRFDVCWEIRQWCMSTRWKVQTFVTRSRMADLGAGSL
jgi:hypothetical protein